LIREPRSARPRATGGPTWRIDVNSARQATVRPSVLAAAGLAAAASLAGLAAVVFGATQLHLWWSVIAGLALVGALVLALRGFPLVAVAPLLLGVVAWGLACRAWLPASWSDVVGVLRFVGANLVFEGPALLAYLGAIAVDSRRMSHAAVDAAVAERRWWGEADDHLPQLSELEAIPAARFFALTHGACSHLTVVGRRVALTLPTVWPKGIYGMDASGQVLRAPLGGTRADARPFDLAGEDLDGLASDLRSWIARLNGTGATVRGFLVIHPPRDGTTADVRLDIAPAERLHIVHAHEFSEVAGGWLAAEPYRIDAVVFERLLAEAGS
jgi:hypothetical protein